MGAGGEKSRVTDTQPGVWCVGGELWAVYLYSWIFIWAWNQEVCRPRNMHSLPLKPPCHTCTPPTPRPSVQAHYRVIVQFYSATDSLCWGPPSSLAARCRLSVVSVSGLACERL